MQQQQTDVNSRLHAAVTQHVQRTDDKHLYSTVTEDSLAAMQRHQILDVVKGITEYLQQDLVSMQQTYKALVSQQK